VEGWSKNVYLGGRRSFPNEPALRALVPVLLASALLFWLVPAAVLLAGVMGAGVSPLLPAAVVATSLSVLFWMLIAYGMEIPPAYGLGYPVGAAMALYIVARSTWRGGRRVEWRGRVYRSGGGGTEDGAT
jgi:hypothetical protein